jgi:excinuclease UvrABC nuclease subunit
LPGVGVERSGAVAAHFPSVKAMVDARAEEWMMVPGIGKTLAARITTALGGE